MTADLSSETQVGGRGLHTQGKHLSETKPSSDNQNPKEFITSIAASVHGHPVKVIPDGHPHPHRDGATSSTATGKQLTYFLYFKPLCKQESQCPWGYKLHKDTEQWPKGQDEK